MKPGADKLRELLRVVMATNPLELDCDGFLSRVGAFLEARAAGEAIPPELQGVSQHLEVCAECVEELEALMRAHGIDPSREEHGT